MSRLGTTSAGRPGNRCRTGTQVQGPENDAGQTVLWLSYGPATEKLCQELWGEKNTIEALAKHHLRLGNQDERAVLPPDHWIRGNFSVCVFVNAKSSSSFRKAVFRCPMPHKLAKARYPSSISEKLSCEIGASVWVEENRPEIRSTHVFGLGYLDGRLVRPPFRRDNDG